MAVFVITSFIAAHVQTPDETPVRRGEKWAAQAPKPKP
jgi:hypothetical protein